LAGEPLCSEPGQVEVHTKETDIFSIVDGTATFVTGGTVVGQKELRANRLTGTSRAVRRIN
jgi:hypothetical protein